MKESSKEAKVIVTDRVPQAVYFMLGGSGPILSVNYDCRYAKRVNEPSFAIGVGYWDDSFGSIFSIPVSVNYLGGRSSHFLEIAAGATYLTGNIRDFFGGTSDINGIIYHLNLGYRYQPSNGGFFFVRV